MNSKKNIFLLSHYLEVDAPSYGGENGFFRKNLSKIELGKTSNSEEWTFKNHIGTHVDFPLHFFKEGKSLSDFSPSSFFYERTQVIDLVATEGQIIGPDDFKNVSFLDCEMLLLRTGFESKRGKEVYWNNNPGLAPELANYFLSLMPNLRAVGFDFISLTAFQNRALGKEAHKAFLGGARELLIIEDMHLSECKNVSCSVFLAPLLVKNADGSPVTVFGY